MIALSLLLGLFLKIQNENTVHFILCDPKPTASTDNTGIEPALMVDETITIPTVAIVNFVTLCYATYIFVSTAVTVELAIPELNRL